MLRWSLRSRKAVWMPSSVKVGGIRMSMMTTSGGSGAIAVINRARWLPRR